MSCKILVTEDVLITSTRTDLIDLTFCTTPGNCTKKHVCADKFWLLLVVRLVQGHQGVCALSMSKWRGNWQVGEKNLLSVWSRHCCSKGLGHVYNQKWGSLIRIIIALAPEYLKEISINCKNLNQGERVLIVCQRLWPDMQHVGPETVEALDQTGGLKRRE